MKFIKTIFLIVFVLLLSFRQTKFDYIFRLSNSLNFDGTLKGLTVEVVNNESSAIQLNNLIFNFYVDDKGYWATSEKIRFLDEALTLQPNQNFKTTIVLDSLTFINFANKRVTSTMEIKQLISNSKITSFKATINDNRKLSNPRSSSSLTHSNIIEFKAN